MLRKSVSIVMICSSLLLGCQTPTNERTFMRFEVSMPAKTRNVPYHGQYRLYATRERNPTTSTSPPPMLDVRLAKGDAVGFARARNGVVHAVVRGEQKPLPAMDASSAGEASYVWTMQPDDGQIDPARTALLVGAVIVVGVAVVVIVAAAAAGPSISFAAPY